MYIFGRGELQTEGILIGKQFSMMFLHDLWQLCWKGLSRIFIEQRALEARDSVSFWGKGQISLQSRTINIYLSLQDKGWAGLLVATFKDGGFLSSKFQRRDTDHCMYTTHAGLPLQQTQITWRTRETDAKAHTACCARNNKMSRSFRVHCEKKKSISRRRKWSTGSKAGYEKMSTEDWLFDLAIWGSCCQIILSRGKILIGIGCRENEMR